MDPATAGLLIGGVGSAVGAGAKAAAAAGSGGAQAPAVNPASGQAGTYYRSPEDRAAKKAEAEDKRFNFQNGTVDGLDPDVAQMLGVNMNTPMNKAQYADRLRSALEQLKQAKAKLPSFMNQQYDGIISKMENDPVLKEAAAADQAEAEAKPSYEEQQFYEANSKSAGMEDYAKQVDQRKAAKIDTTGAERAYQDTLAGLNNDWNTLKQSREQSASRQALLQLSQGQGPAAEAARAQLQAGIDSSNAQAMSMAASARGGAGAHALSNRTALMQAALNNQVGANQAALMRANMSMEGIKGLANQDSDWQGQDTKFAGMRGDVGTKRAGFYGDAATSDAANAVNQTRINDIASAGARAQGMDWWKTARGFPQQAVDNSLKTESAISQRAGVNAGADANKNSLIFNAIDSGAGAATGVGTGIGTIKSTPPAPLPGTNNAAVNANTAGGGFDPDEARKRGEY